MERLVEYIYIKYNNIYKIQNIKNKIQKRNQTQRGHVERLVEYDPNTNAIMGGGVKLSAAECQ